MKNIKSNTRWTTPITPTVKEKMLLTIYLKILLTKDPLLSVVVLLSMGIFLALMLQNGRCLSLIILHIKSDIRIDKV